MATAKGKGPSFRSLFKALEKSKNNSRGQNQALVMLSVCFLINPERRNKAGFKQTLASTVRWYENNRRYFDKDILKLGLEGLNEVFHRYGYSSLAETPSCLKENMDILLKVRLLCNSNQIAEALSLLKTMEGKVEKAVKASDLTAVEWVLSFFKHRGTCFAKLEMYHLAIQDYSQYLARSTVINDPLPSKVEKIVNLEEPRQTRLAIQRRRGICHYEVGYYEEAKSDLKIILKKPPTPINAALLVQLDALCQSFLWLKRYKHGLLAAYQHRFYTKKLDMPMVNSWFATLLLAVCLHKNKKYVEANWILSDMILDCQDDLINLKVAALGLNGHCLMEMKKYAQAMRTFNQAIELTSSKLNLSKLRIRFAMYKYAYDAQDMAYLTDLKYLVQPWKTYYPVFLIEKGMAETTSVKFVIEESIQEVKHSKSEEAQNHLMFCNSVMITKMFKK